MFNGHKGDGDPEGELPGDNGKGDRENDEGDRTIGKGQRPILKGEPLGEEEPDLFVSVFVSSISVLGSAFPTNTKNNISLPYFTLRWMELEGILSQPIML